MTPTDQPVRGLYGTAVPVQPAELVDGHPHAGVGPTWLLTCPARGTAWTQWMLAAVHLHPRPGVRAAVLQRPGVTHEILVVALHPDHGPYSPAVPMPWPHLTPVNIAEQITADDDRAVVDLLSLLGQAVVHGVLDPETADAPSRVRAEWSSSIAQTLAHSRGEHQ